jgi:hypothetical protein
MTGEKDIITQSLRPFPGVYAECLKEKIESAEARRLFFGRDNKKIRFSAETL